MISYTHVSDVEWSLRKVKWPIQVHTANGRAQVLIHILNSSSSHMEQGPTLTHAAFA